MSLLLYVFHQHLNDFQSSEILAAYERVDVFNRRIQLPVVCADFKIEQSLFVHVHLVVAEAQTQTGRVEELFRLFVQILVFNL